MWMKAQRELPTHLLFLPPPTKETENRKQNKNENQRTYSKSVKN